MTKATIDQAFDQLAEGLWARLRDILMTQSRWDAFVRDPEGNRPEPPTVREESARLASEMVLRALRVAVDPVNHAILNRLTRVDGVALSALAEQTGLSQTALIETINDLSQVGLASYAVETREVRPTAGTIGLVGLLDEVRRRLALLVSEQRRDGA